MRPCKDGYYRKSYFFEGKQYHVSGKTEKEVMQKWAELVSSLNRGENQVNGTMTVKAWSQLWLETYIKPRVRKAGAPKTKDTMTQKSYDMYAQKLDGYILPVIKNLRLKDVTDVHLQRILNAQAGGSYSTAQKIKIIIQAMFRQAYISRLIMYDPSASISLPATTEGKRRSLTDEERALLLQATKIHRCGLWIKMLLATGIRPGESSPLQVKDFDFKTNMLAINKDLESGTYVVGNPKTEAGIRKVPIPEDLVPELQEAFKGKSPFDIAFPNTHGNMKTQTSISNDWRSFRRCMDILGGARTIWKDKERTISEDGYEATNHGRIMTLELDEKNGSVLADDLVLYCLRHTYCTDLQKAGVPIDVARQLMGHADIQTTANIYTHANDVVLQAAAVSINAYRMAEENSKIISKNKTSNAAAN